MLINDTTPPVGASASPAPTPMESLHADSWEARYGTRDTPWDLGGPNPALVALLERSGEWGLKPPARVLVPGCGRGHDGQWLLKKGFWVMGVDFAPSAVADARAAWEKYGRRARVVQADVFDLPASWEGRFDAVVEHTCFCAIDPARRAEYVAAIHRVIKPGGLLLGVFFLTERAGGPPFGSSEAELDSLFAGPFEQLHRRPAQGSISRRAGTEWEVVLRATRPQPPQAP